MSLSELIKTRPGMWGVTNVMFTCIIGLTFGMEIISFHLRTGLWPITEGVTWLDTALVVVFWLLGSTALYIITFYLIASDKIKVYTEGPAKRQWIQIAIATVIVNLTEHYRLDGSATYFDVLLHCYYMFAFFVLLYPFMDAFLDGFFCKKEKRGESWRDHYFAHRIKNTLAWRRWVIHAGRLRWDSSLSGIGWPEAMITIDPDGEEMFHVWLHCGLFGFGFSSARLPYIHHTFFKGRYRLGFYTCKSHILFSLLDNEDFRGWQGGKSFLFHWENMLKGKETVTLSDPAPMGPIVMETIPCEGFPTEELTLLTERSVLTRRYSRWPSPPELERWRVYTLEDDHVACLPGKGENGWDCDDEYGIDVTLGAMPIGTYTPYAAAKAAIHNLDDDRRRRLR